MAGLPPAVDALTAAHDDDHLGKFEALLENAVDLDKIPDEYTICASYDHDLGLIQRDKVLPVVWLTVCVLSRRCTLLYRGGTGYIPSGRMAGFTRST